MRIMTKNMAMGPGHNLIKFKSIMMMIEPNENHDKEDDDESGSKFNFIWNYNDDGQIII